MSFLKLDTIGKKILIPVTLLIMILLLCLGTSMVLNNQSSVRSMMDSKGNSLANLIEKISAPYIINYDFPALEGFVQEAIKDPDVVFAVFHDAGGKVLTQNSKVPSDTSALAVYKRDIKGQDGNTIATLEIGYSKNTLSKILRDGIINIAVSILIAMLFTLLGLTFLVRNITGILKRVIEGMKEGTDTVASVSVQVSAASQELAEGASEQAAGIEEASSSVEEMASMTRQNAENARQANSMMAETRKVVEMADQSMKELTGAMREISTASEETAKIIKTIDEIAFQTNLLALNAAVEAARAGEAGAGFAVVADEVRNLALRSAEAAKNTASLIEGTVKKIKNGSEIVSKTNDAFSTVTKGAKKVGELVEEISAASNEQAQGVEQINRAITEMEKVVQTNASGAEESASAAAEMTAQSEQMKVYVADLVRMVGGSAKGSTSSRSVLNDVKSSKRAALTAAHNSLPVLVKKGDRRTGSLSSKVTRRPEKVIPLVEGEFKDF
jgi:methyl-accepting chemotaxis protein